MPEEFRNNVSVVIVNYDRIETTVKCVQCVVQSHGDYVGEILVVDNGSPPDAVSALGEAIAPSARLIGLGTNRYFGEGNNIGVEEATGDFVLLLNNDAYVDPACISELVGSLQDDPSIAAVGPMFLYPDGSVQEVGGIVLETGDIVQVGKGSLWGSDHYTQQCTVDYCSAACLLFRRKDFLDTGGFALQWEPAYYEDVDLCLSLWQQVGPIVVNPRARVVHLESLTTGDAKMRLESQVEINRLTFVEKWGPWIKAKQATRPDAAVEPCASGSRYPRGDTSQPGKEIRQPEEEIRSTARRKVIDNAVLYSPYELIPGGGERVLFELASVLAETIGAPNVRMASAFRYSNLRMHQLSAAFGVSGPTTCTTLYEFRNDPPAMTIVLGNQIAPPIPGYGRRVNIYLCQFPFYAPDQYIKEHLPDLATFDEIWVYSDFVSRYVSGYLRLWGVRAPKIRVIYPPATLPAPDQLPSWAERTSVMTVGRFFKGGHNKRQDVVIEIVKELAERFNRTVTLNIAGALHATADSRDRFRELISMADGIECRFYPNVSRERLLGLYAEAAVLVHATGYGIDRYAFPERLEHFGITPIEAASMGCIPLVYDEGGPAEVMRKLGCPTTYRTIPEAVERLNGLFSDSSGAEALSRDLIRKSSLFSREAFRDRVIEALSSLV